MNSKIIALTAISSAIIAVFLTLGAYIEFIDVFSIVIASIFVILPLYYKSYLASFLCFLSGGVLAFLFSGFNIFSIIFPAYFGFAGIYPIIKCRMADKNFNKIFSYIIGVVWCVAAFYGIYYYYLFVANGILDGLPEFIEKYLIYFVGIAGAVFYFVYDRFIYVMRFAFDRYLSKIIK